jgi:hypothetical protein
VSRIMFFGCRKNSTYHRLAHTRSDHTPRSCHTHSQIVIERVPNHNAATQQRRHLTSQHRIKVSGANRYVSHVQLHLTERGRIFDIFGAYTDTHTPHTLSLDLLAVERILTR